MREINFRCSSVGKLMTEARAKGELLSQGAKSHIRELAQQHIFGVDFEFSSRETQKGIEVESDSIALLNQVRGLSLTKNTERRTVNGLTGEPDCIDRANGRGHDIKSSWSVKTFPAFAEDCEDKLYEWQARGYMALFDVDSYEVNWCLVDTPEHLIGYEPMQMHLVGHIPAHMRVTTWEIERDLAKERALFDKLEAARDYYLQVVKEFDKSHPQPESV